MAIVALTRNGVGISPSALRRMGIRALVEVSESPSRIVEVIQSVAAGDDLLTGVNSADDTEGVASVNLTKREREILRLLATGRRNVDIASELSLSVQTVEFHVSSVLMKLGAKSRTEAADIARKLGMLSVDN